MSDRKIKHQPGGQVTPEPHVPFLLGYCAGLLLLLRQMGVETCSLADLGVGEAGRNLTLVI